MIFFDDFMNSFSLSSCLSLWGGLSKKKLPSGGGGQPTAGQFLKNYFSFLHKVLMPKGI